MEPWIWVEAAYLVRPQSDFPGRSILIKESSGVLKLGISLGNHPHNHGASGYADSDHKHHFDPNNL